MDHFDEKVQGQIVGGHSHRDDVIKAYNNIVDKINELENKFDGLDLSKLFSIQRDGEFLKYHFNNKVYAKHKHLDEIAITLIKVRMDNNLFIDESF